MKRYDFAFSNTQTIQDRKVLGDYIYYNTGALTGATDDSIIVTGLGGGQVLDIVLKPGQGVRLPDKFSGVRVTPLATLTAGQTLNCYLTIGNGKIEDNRPSGVVEVVDGAYSTSAQGKAFSAAGEYSPGAGQFAALQLLNTGTQQIVVEAVQFSTGIAANARLIVYSTALSGGASAYSPTNKLTSAAAPACEFRYQSMVAAPLGAYLKHSYSNVSQASFELLRPIILQPAAGLVVACGVADAGISASFDCYYR